ncbi:hypothetical protein A2686_02935 [Candidatus Woesebacteria bacterium RIFCSPHIGHO2_01_FULL_38_10]|uniref:Large ribosomal subunit protein uL1 n=1 Tax=Candidatus Woesebacteria bacterium RIFCSPLOWO2_01_FULL_39_10b TaxID=1802517 RepID=A0A1F8B8Z9_9BACT|nr:MAG: hypothetical protein A2686_02935 [Candidatus Woesebacteria bacterium RIFCSPHIGHO2_01_FULL_38_10]OGM60513.1 MAG: hypothetical protein A2892_00625 [Candidatus Woesebacteria bacterium RIFCSPLOWO2_01_FULL_39_10b]
MGKTKTATISDFSKEKKSGKEIYEEKRVKKEEKRAKEEKKTQVESVGLKGGERIKVVTGEIPDVAEEEKSVAKRKKAKVRGKKYLKLRSKIDKSKLYKLPDAIKLVKKTSYSKFDGTIELHLITKRAKINENVKLPYPTGKEKKIEVADEKTIEKLKKGKIDFDLLLATSEMMPKLLTFAKVLGPKGLMPNPKTGTLIKEAKDAKKFSANTLVVKTEKKQPVIHTIIGKVSQKENELEENALAIIKAVGEGKQLVKAYLCSTMSPSVKLNLS